MQNPSNVFTVWLQLQKRAKYNDIEVIDYMTKEPSQLDMEYLDSNERYVRVTIEFPDGYFEPRPLHGVVFAVPPEPTEPAPKGVDPTRDHHSAWD